MNTAFLTHHHIIQAQEITRNPYDLHSCETKMHHLIKTINDRVKKQYKTTAPKNKKASQTETFHSFTLEQNMIEVTILVKQAHTKRETLQQYTATYATDTVVFTNNNQQVNTGQNKFQRAAKTTSPHMVRKLGYAYWALNKHGNIELAHTLVSIPHVSDKLLNFIQTHPHIKLTPSLIEQLELNS